MLLQYGHNAMKSTAPDAPQTYKTLLNSWVLQGKARGGIPVFNTHMNGYSFQGNTVTKSLGEYPEMMREAAREEASP